MNSLIVVEDEGGGEKDARFHANMFMLQENAQMAEKKNKYHSF